MTKIAVGRNSVADELFQLLDLGKTPLFRARPDQGIVDMHFEYPARVFGHERDRAEFLGES